MEIGRISYFEKTMKNNIFFDITHYTFTKNIRDVTICIDGQTCIISETQFGDTDLWIVQSYELEQLLKQHFKPFQPMFFGILLKELHIQNALLPIKNIRLHDLELAFQQKTSQLDLLAQKIASHSYAASVPRQL